MTVDLAGLKILIVEDEALIAIGVEEEIRRLGATETYIAYHKIQALEAVEQFKPDLAIIDVSLTDTGSDYAIADALADARVPFIFSSGHLAGELPDRHAGRPFVGKPMQTAELITALGMALSTNDAST